MKKIIMFLLVSTSSFLICKEIQFDDTINENKVESINSKYIRVPISFDTSRFQFSFGKETSHEISISLDFSSDPNDDFTQSTNYQTLVNQDVWSEADQDWIYNEYLQNYTRIIDITYDHEYDINIGFGYKKYFTNVLKERYNRSFYVSSNLNISYSSRKDIYKITYLE